MIRAPTVLTWINRRFVITIVLTYKQGSIKAPIGRRLWFAIDPGQYVESFISRAPFRGKKLTRENGYKFPGGGFLPNIHIGISISIKKSPLWRKSDKFLYC